MKKLFILFLTWLPLFSMAQKIPDYGLHQVRINDTDKTILAEILPVKTMSQVRSELDYYWYGANRIHRQQGGFSGQLLNGTYQEYYQNKSLKTQGAFEKGLRNGVWKDWNENGRLSLLTTWDNGLRSGRFSLYNTEGKVIQSGSYVRDRLDGPVTFNAGTDSLKIIRYKKGQPVPPKSGTFLKRINIFKKHTQKSIKTVQ